MSIKSCPEHHELDTMVPCLGCGRDFCRVCFPVRGAGQYCPQCYQESVRRLSAGKEKKEKPPGRFNDRARAAVAPRLSALRDRTGRIAGAAKERFPVALAGESQEELMPFARSWYRLLAVTLGGMGLWILMVAFTHRRLLAYSIITAVLVSAGVVFILGTMQDLGGAVLATALAVFAIVLGELLVQLLFRAGIIGDLDILRVSPYYETTSAVFYKGYFYSLLIKRLLPAAAVAFVVGFWPLPKRLVWKGFTSVRTDGPERKSERSET